MAVSSFRNLSSEHAAMLATLWVAGSEERGASAVVRFAPYTLSGLSGNVFVEASYTR